jgi:hypothetical protein
MTSPAPHNDRLEELQAGAALERLTVGEEVELAALGGDDDAAADLSFELTAAALELALLQPRDLAEMPDSVHLRVQAAGAAWAAAHSQALREARPLNSPRVFARRPVRAAVRVAPWAAAAACLALAFSWHSVAADPIKQVDKDPNKMEVQLAAWNEGAPNASAHCGHACGCVRWSESHQCGYIKLHGVPLNDCEHQYQIWIIDDHGEDQRISAGVFDCKGGDCIIPIHPAIAVHHASAFAITMEKMGGTCVSDMSHRVAIGQCAKR